jgi:PDZ domain-containing protein
MNVRRLVKPLAIAAATLFVAAVALFIYAQIALSSSYLLLPDKPHSLGALVKVHGGHVDKKGGIYFVDVIEQQATLAQRYLPFLRGDGASLVPRQDVVPNNVSTRLQARLDRAAMARSKKIAAAIALENLGYKVVVRPRGVLVGQVEAGFPAANKLLPGDVITAVDGRPALTESRVLALITRHHVGQLVKLTFIRNGHEHQVTVRTVASPYEPHRPVVGVVISQAAAIKLPIKVEIDPGNVGGPSAGLAFALELTEKLGPDIDHGYRIAATGELELDGSVVGIGGVEQKVIGARKAGIQVMLVPAGDNAKTARRYAGAMKIIPVKSFQQALHDLATLPPNR